MSPTDSTCWTVIQGASAGSPNEREAFARLYLPVVRAYLAARWKDSRYREHEEDTLQDVFLECFRRGGALEHVDIGRSGGFRAFLFGVVRNVALRTERRVARVREVPPPSDIQLDELAEIEEEPARAFDRAWARTLVQDALARQESAAREAGPAAEKRLELLRLRFQEGLTVREIAQLWQADAERLHEDYSRARGEFKNALIAVVHYHHPSATAGEAERESMDLLALLK